MTDVVNRSTRSRMMSRIRGKNTGPELVVRKHLHRAGLRYRISPANLPGSPDIVLPRYRAVVFVHGCFWHRHEGCRFATSPKTNIEFWRSKFDMNVARDKRVTSELQQAGWRVFVVWSCAITEENINALMQRIRGTAE